ncbi:MAG: P-type conjugative transfer protein TrbJ [Amphiplicatus sp.]|jgi:type IV secretion system protein TrbJ
MRRRMKSRLLATIFSLALGFGLAGSAHAQFFGGIVYDPTNYAQNLLTATRTLTMINNQVKQLTNEAQMLLNEAKELTNLPYSARVQLNQRLLQIETLIKTANGLAYNVASIDASFRALFPEDYSSVSNAAMASDARRHWEEASRAFHDAMIMQAKIAETISADLTDLDAIVAKSETAVGNLQVEQAGNQLLAMQVKQAMQAAELFAVASRADALDRARQLQTEERARIANARFIGDGIMYP